MNIKEPHVVTGMSRDSAVSQHNPNFVYDAHNIRITTKDGSNSLLSVTNERGTKQVVISEDSDIITGTPIGSAAIGDYVIIFTHETITRADGESEEHYQLRLSNCDHIYRCLITSTGATVKAIFEGNANFAVEHPIEALPVFETKEIQKVYWVDGINQPRMINIVRSTKLTDVNKMNFSREIALNHDPMNIIKSNGGGLFPTGTIQYMYSYYDMNGQETRLVDCSPMFYLSPQDKGAPADSNVTCSFIIKLNNLDTSFDFVRIYSVVRTMENGKPQARCLGDFPCKTSIEVTDDGIIGRTVEASSLYFIGGEECIAGTIAQKDNTLFLGNIELTRPNLIDVPIGFTTLGALVGTPDIGECQNVDTHWYSVDSQNSQDKAPHSNEKYYDYSIDNNRSSYYIKRFKCGEYYRLGFIAQYRNGQWSDPLWITDKQQEIRPKVAQDYYQTGRFNAEIPATVVNAMLAAGYKRIAPVVSYPKPHERKTIAQGVICPTVYQKRDREENAPYMQSSWFFRYAIYATARRLGGNNHPSGEIQSMGIYNSGNTSKDDFYTDPNFITFHSPDIDCMELNSTLDLDNLNLFVIGQANSHKQRIVEHFLTIENSGINTDYSQIIDITNNTLDEARHDYFTHNAPLYCDSIVNNAEEDTVEAINKEHVLGWIVYPWHRSGSLNNQKALSTKQKKEGFTTRTALLKRNITATVWFTAPIYNNEYREYTISKPVLFNADQLAAVRVRSIDGEDSYNYYGNIDKVLKFSGSGSYYIYHGWHCAVSELSTKSPQERSEEAITIGYNSTPNTEWRNSVTIDDETYGSSLMLSNDPVSMKYKSTPHLIMQVENPETPIVNIGDANNPQFVLCELQRANYSHVNTNVSDMFNLQWLRCGESVKLIENTKCTIDYLQGDCYVQRYDCLKTYAFTNEDTNSVIEILSTMIESYVNLDFRTDSHRGGTNNYTLNPTNFNLFNHNAYEQSSNFFVYRMLDPSIPRTNKFPNVVTWSLEKHFGEDVDTWASVDITNTVDLDGAMGELNKLINYNNDIYAFQNTGFAQLLFNSRVQIPTSDDTPIEITNGMKMQGKRYISTKIGCTNKWSIIETPLGLYFNDDILRTTYLFNGQVQDISTTKGMKSWMNDKCNQTVWTPMFSNCRAFYDKLGKDIYWIYNDTALVYSEILNAYMSFMDYGSVPLIENAGNSTFAVLPVNNTATEDSETAKVFVQARGHAQGYIVFTCNSAPKPISMTVRVMEPVDQAIYPAATASIVETDIITITTTIYSSNTNEQEDYCFKYTLQRIKEALSDALNAYFSISLDGELSDSDVLDTSTDNWLDFTEGPFNFNTIIAPEQQSPFWELGTGSYNMFFDRFRPYWLTFISNLQPTENKIYNNLEWRDIVKDNLTDKPFSTFDHVEVWTEHQSTGSVRFSNSIKEFTDKQPIQYNARMSNLRKKFNVWRCQIPRDYIASNSRRARISNPWCYIKLSREDVNTYRHEFTDLVVDYFM